MLSWPTARGLFWHKVVVFCVDSQMDSKFGAATIVARDKETANKVFIMSLARVKLVLK
jgi:hypothetical protein